MSGPCLRCIGGAKIAAIMVAAVLALAPGSTPALAQSVGGSAFAYLSIPLDGSTDGPVYGLRLDLGDRHGAGSGALGLGSNGPPPVLEVRSGSGKESGGLHVGGIAPAMVPDRLALDDRAALWIGAGLGFAAVVGIVIAADVVCVGINAPCPKDEDDEDSNDDDTNEPTRN